MLTPVSHGHRLQQRRARGRTRAGRRRPRRPLDVCTSPHCSEPCSSLPPPPPPPSPLPTTSPFTEMPCLTATLVEGRRAHLGKVPPAWRPPCPLCTSPQLAPCQHQHPRQVGTLVSFGKWGSVSFPIKIFLKNIHESESPLIPVGTPEEGKPALQPPHPSSTQGEAANTFGGASTSMGHPPGPESREVTGWLGTVAWVPHTRALCQHPIPTALWAACHPSPLLPPMLFL